MLLMEKATEISDGKRQEKLEFGGGLFFVRIEGEVGSIERADKCLLRLGITIPGEKEKVNRKKNPRVNIKIAFHNDNECATEKEKKLNREYSDWVLDTIIPRVEHIKCSQRIKAKNDNFSEKEAKTTIEIIAAVKKGSEHIAMYNANI